MYTPCSLNQVRATNSERWTNEGGKKCTQTQISDLYRRRYIQCNTCSGRPGYQCRVWFFSNELII